MEPHCSNLTDKKNLTFVDFSICSFLQVSISYKLSFCERAFL